MYHNRPIEEGIKSKIKDTIQSTVADYLCIDKKVVSADYKLPEDKQRELVMKVEMKCDVDIPNDSVSELNTPEKIYQFIKDHYWTHP
ncbi:MAG: hypothetical protein U9R34_07560 [Nanoarchaeota archaeon]|nr:hypothetical protein [Nanoarchaeota archaeon]